MDNISGWYSEVFEMTNIIMTEIWIDRFYQLLIDTYSSFFKIENNNMKFNSYHSWKARCFSNSISLIPWYYADNWKRNFSNSKPSNVFLRRCSIFILHALKSFASTIECLNINQFLAIMFLQMLRKEIENYDWRWKIFHLKSPDYMRIQMYSLLQQIESDFCSRDEITDLHQSSFQEILILKIVPIQWKQNWRRWWVKRGLQYFWLWLLNCFK